MGARRAVALAALASAAALVAAAETFTPHSFTLQQLQRPDARVLQDLVSAIEHVGLFTVTDWDYASGDGGSPFHGALDSYVACEKGPLQAASEDTLRRVEMEDGTQRHTVATATRDSSPLPLPAEVMESCPAFAAASERLRRDVDAAGRAYAKVLDLVVYGGEPPSPTSSFVTAAQRAESLEHFHVFLRDDASPFSKDGNAMLPMHSDIGLFLVMTVAEYVDRATGTRLTGAARPKGTGLVVELAPGYRVTPVLPEGALVVMNGEAAVRWMQAGALTPRAPLHEVLPLGTAAAARAWFGRMYFPPANAELRVQEGEEPSADARATVDASLKFGDYLAHSEEAFHSDHEHLASAAGCAPRPAGALVGATRRLADAKSCKAEGKFYCWMSCRDIPAGTTCARSELRCVNPLDGTRWPADYKNRTTGAPTHCFDCVTQCRDQGAKRCTADLKQCKADLAAQGRRALGISDSESYAMPLDRWL